MPLPLLTLLSPAQCAEIHSASLHILETAGVRVDSPRAREIFARSGGCRQVDDRIYLSPALVESALASAPSTVEVFDRHREPAFNLGAQRTRFGIGVTNLYYQDPLTEAVTPFTRPLLASCVRLGEALPGFDVVSTIGILHDQPPHLADLFAVLEMVANTHKPLVILISNESLFPAVLDLLETLRGDLAAKPFVIPYLNPVTPLIINEGTSDKLLACAERGLPFIYSNYGMAGMSTPLTPAGTLVLLNAELLAGLVLAQIARPGTPVILGSLPAYFDMQTMVDFYDPRTFLLNLSCAEMMTHYHLPHAGTSGSGMGWGADLLETGALWMDLLTGSLGKVGVSPFVGGALGSKAFSPSTAVYADELIAMLRDFESGFTLDGTAILLDQIIAGVAEGHFLSQPETLKYFGRTRKGGNRPAMDPRAAYYPSRIFPRWGLESWQDNGAPLALDYLKQRTLKLLAETLPPGDHDELLARGETFIASLPS
jgi:trimethylamine---corrinoid protein Co-methyltransferase